MRISFSRTQALPEQSTPPKSIQGKRKPILVSGGISHCRECSLDSRRGDEIALIYNVSQAFQGAEAKYPRIEKIAFALIVVSRKLQPYFHANPILVMTDQPIRKSMNKPEAAGRMVQLAIELCQFNIEYHPRIAIKAQALAEQWTI